MRTVQVALFALLAAMVAAEFDMYHPDEKLRTPEPPGKLFSREVDDRAPNFWSDSAKTGINKYLSIIKNEKIARNIILFLGDGMSIPTQMAARTLKGQRKARTGEESELFFEKFPTVGLSKTYCLDKQVPDSACTATAYLTGVKTNYGMIGLTGDVRRGNCDASTRDSTHLDSIAAWAIASGRDAGIVTTTKVTDASPAGAYARVADRAWQADVDVKNKSCPDIAMQLITTSPGNQFKVIFGGGRDDFVPSNVTVNVEDQTEGVKPGRRGDNRNLIQEWQNDKAVHNYTYQYIWKRSQLMNLTNSPPDFLLGLFHPSHLSYATRRDKTTQPTLAELTEVAITSLNRNDRGFFLFVEGGLIDHGHHVNSPLLALDETLEMAKAVEKAVEMLGDDTLIVVTADHAHVMSVAGYTKRGGDILGPSDSLGADKIPYMTLSYINGPGARGHVNGSRVDVTKEDYKNSHWKSHAEVIRNSETHGGDDVAVFAYGPYNHLFAGVFEESHIPFKMAYAACIGPGLHADACNSDAANLNAAKQLAVPNRYSAMLLHSLYVVHVLVLTVLIDCTCL